MHILIGLAMALALFYFWLLGHWFARVLLFLLLGVVFGVAGFAVAAGADKGGAFILGVIGVVAAWFTAGIPIYYWRYQLGLPSKLRACFEHERPASPVADPYAHAPSWAKTPERLISRDTRAQ